MSMSNTQSFSKTFFLTCCESVVAAFHRSISIRVFVELYVDSLFHVVLDYLLRYPIPHRRNPKFPCASILLGYLYSLYLSWNVTSRGHAIPDHIQLFLYSFGLEVNPAFLIYAWCFSSLSYFLVCFGHHLISDGNHSSYVNIHVKSFSLEVFNC